MTTFSTYLTDSATLLRRNLRHMRRYPLIFFIAGIPIVFLLLFVFVLGGTLGAGLSGGSGGRADYVAYVTPGVLILGVAGAAQGTAISVAMDMTEGIVARFRTMAISRASFLTGHVLANVLQTMVALVLVIIVALVIGLRPTAGPVEWVGAFGLLTLMALALTWISVALGMVSKSVETASNLPMPLLLLPFFGSGFVPTDSMPEPLRWFADYQPFTPIIETLRALLLGGDIGGSGVVAVAWCVGIALFGYGWAIRLYARDPAR
jgi:ABC-2 type transport system permease protein